MSDDSANLVPDESWHYPPDLLSLLVDVIPLLCRSKRDVIMFFRGAGVAPVVMAGCEQQLASDRTQISKYAIARTVLQGVNEGGDLAIRERREIIKRIVEFEDYSACWPADQLRARGLVVAVREVVNVKDSFTRINQERERERKASQAARAARIRELQATQDEREKLARDLFALFGEVDRRRRGKALEPILNRLFQSFGILVKEAFTVTGTDGEGIVEQVDGAIVLDGHLYLVEMKWREPPLGPPEVAQHLVRVFSRDGARGLMISASRFTDAAIQTCREALRQKVYVLTELREIVALLDSRNDLAEFLRRKVAEVILQKEPLVFTTIGGPSIR